MVAAVIHGEHIDRQTDRHDESNRRFSQLREHSENKPGLLLTNNWYILYSCTVNEHIQLIRLEVVYQQQREFILENRSALLLMTINRTSTVLP